MQLIALGGSRYFFLETKNKCATAFPELSASPSIKTVDAKQSTIFLLIPLTIRVGNKPSRFVVTVDAPLLQLS